MAESIEQLDWSATPLGPRTQWPVELTTALNLCLDSRFPILLWCGPECVMLYNDAYRPLLGASKHPRALGAPGAEVFPEVWDVIGPMLRSVLATGAATYARDLLLVLERNGFPEECYVTLSYSPIRASDGSVLGVFTAATETTEQVIRERHLRTLSSLATAALGATTVEETCQGLVSVLKRNPVDIPFALLYLPFDLPFDRVLEERAAEPLQGPQTLRLAGSAHVPDDHPLSQGHLEAARAEGPIAEAVFKAVRSGRLATAHGLSHYGTLPSGPWAEQPRVALAVPLPTAGSDEPLGVVVLGLSAARPLDDAVMEFADLIGGQAAIGLGRARALEEERKRVEAVAEARVAATLEVARVRSEASEALRQRQEELLAVFNRAPIGVVLVDQSLRIRSVNPMGMLAFRPGEIVNENLETLVQGTWPAPLAEAALEQVRHTLATGKSHLQREFTGARRDRPERESYYWEIHAVTLPDGQRGAISYFRNITREVRVREDLIESEMRFRTMADSAPVMVWIADEKGACDWVNRPWLEFRGRTQDEEHGTGWHEGLHPDDAQRWLTTYEEHFRRREPFELEYRMRRADGAWRWIVDRGVPLYEGSHDRFAGYIGSCLDITDRKEVERALAQAYDRLELAVDAADLGTFFCPMPLEKIYWNNKCKEHFFLPPEAEIDFDLFYARLHPDDRERVRAAVGRAVFDGELYDIQYRTRGPAGQERWLRAKGRAYFDNAGKPVRFDGITIDVSDLKRLEEERARLLDVERRARIEAEHVSHMKDQFLATLSHELRTPLNAILGWSHILRRRVGTDGGVATSLGPGLEAIERNARAQTRLIEDLLDMSRIVSGKLRLERLPLSVSDVVDTALASLTPSIDAKYLQLLTWVEEPGLFVLGDANRLQQVLWNLLANAIKFTPPGGKIEVTVARAERDAVLRVADSGCGISPEFLPHVFERFRQEDASTTRAHAGLGLGLSIVKNLVELHGGTVTADSAGENRGSTFTVRLPLLSDDERMLPAAKVARDLAELPLRGSRMLVIDDDADARDVASGLLTQAGATVYAARSATEAFQALDTERFDLLISDLGMPGMDGYEFMRELRTRPQAIGGALPAIALTAFARGEDRERVLTAGYQRHLSKPIEANALLETCLQLLGRD